MGPQAIAENHRTASSARDGSSFVEAAQLASAHGMAQLAQRLRLDLANALPRHGESEPDLLQRQVGALAGPEAQPQDLLLAGRERAEYLARLPADIARQHGIHERDGALVLEEVAEVAVLLLAHRRVEGDRLPRDAQRAAPLVARHAHLRADLLGCRLAPQILHEHARDPQQLVERLHHVHGNADGPRLIGDGARDRLADPPGGIRRELVTALVLEFLDRAHEADVSLLDQVQELQPAMQIALGDRHHQAQVGLDQLLLGGVGTGAGGEDVTDHPHQRRGGEPDGTLEFAKLLPRGAPLVGHLLHAGARAWALARELVQARLELRHAGPCSCQLVHYQRDLPAREPEAEQGRRQPLVQPRETRGAARERGAAEPARRGTQYGFALGHQTAEAGELREEASALT